MDKEIVKYGKAFESESSIAALRQTAAMFSLSAFVKAQELKGGTQQAVNNAMILASMAMDFNLPVHYLFNQVYFVHGQPCFSSQFFIAQFNMSGKFSRIQYEITGKGEDLGCVASCIELATKEKLSGSRVTIGMAHQSRWSPIWDKLPDQMLRYRSAVFLIRSIAPEVMFGMYTVDEQRDIANAESKPSYQPQDVVDVEPEYRPNPREEFEQLCILEEIDSKLLLDFTLEKYAQKGLNKTSEEAMELFLKNPSLIKKAKGQIAPSNTPMDNPSVDEVNAKSTEGQKDLSELI